MPTTTPLALFYSYAHADEKLRAKLDTHLALLRKQNIIHAWHDREVSAGNLWAAEIDAHLQSAHIILLLISPAFMDSDYCYGRELQEALRRHETGAARVIPIILRPCDWEDSPIGKLQALPKDKKPVTMWTNRDAAFTDIVKGIRKVVDELNGPVPVEKARTTIRKKLVEGADATGGRSMQGSPASPGTPSVLSTPVLRKAIDRYYKELEGYEGRADYELAVRSAFQNLLADTARQVTWALIPEQTLEKGIRPDGVLRDGYELRRGYWEAKGPKSDLDKEIASKIAAGYPLTNTIFENTKLAVLYQNKKRADVFDLHNPNAVGDLLKQFFTYTEPDIATFEAAVQEFKERIPELAEAVLKIIEKEYKQNKKFIAAFDAFTDLCRTALDPKITPAVINEMLIQHLLTERIFRTVFDNADFVNRNVIASEIEKVIQALTSRSFNRREFLKSLDRFYVAIESAAKGIENWSERQHFLNTVYERFFQGYSVKRADTYGIVYTPQEIVDFMCASVDEVLRREFNTSLEEPGVQIIDPCVGTGSFIVNLLHRIPRHRLKHKYAHDLFCNEVMLLPYYIASLNIEHEYYAKMGEYESFEGICFTDTLELAEGRQLPLFVEENTERVQREKDAQIMVVIGNPPYNVGQRNENDNNKNRKYPLVDEHVRETYARASKASNKNALSDAYVKFFRWAADRLQGRDGIVCFVSNNSFVDQIAFDGMRKHLLQDFTQIYHLDLHGNVRKNPKLSGTTHNVFGIQVGVGITIAIRLSRNFNRKIYYHRMPENWSKSEKLLFLKEKEQIFNCDWKELEPNEKHVWITDGMRTEFASFIPMGTKEAKSDISSQVQTLFKKYSLGVSTARDIWVSDFNFSALFSRVKRFIDIYNGEVDRWQRKHNNISIDDFVVYEDSNIKWSEGLKLSLQRNQYAEVSQAKMRLSVYRPFCKQWLFFDRILNERVYLNPQFFPNGEQANIAICLTNLGSEKPFMVLPVDSIPNYHLVGAGAATICFSYYTYNEDGTNRRENITDWALAQTQAVGGPEVDKGGGICIYLCYFTSPSVSRKICRKPQTGSASYSFAA